MKKIIAVVLSLTLLLLCLAACGQTKTKTDDNGVTVVVKPDKTFISDVSKAIQERWKVTDADSSKTFEAKSDEEKNALESYINAELNILSPYADSTFDDAAMQSKAVNYVKALKAQIEALEFLSSDRAKFLEQFSAAYAQEKALLKDFVDNYNLAVAPEYEDRLAELVGTVNAAAAAAGEDDSEEGKTVAEAQNEKSALDTWAAAVAFTKQDDGSYAADVENTTGKSFNVMSLKVVLVDEDGNEVGQSYPTVNDYDEGSSKTFSFTTDTEFASTRVSVDFYEEKSE